MKNILTIITLFLSFLNLQSQINWAHNIEEAQIKSLSENKLIIIDFWASWCKPCKKMDQELWSHKEMARVAQRFIPLRIDIDTNQDLVIKYGIKAIPAVVIITANGDIIWQRRDYTSANAHLKLLKAIPNDITTINKAIKPILQKDIQLQTLANLGKAYQHIGATIDNKKFKNRFFKLSNHYFKLAQKEKGSKEAKQELVLLSILNDVYKGNTKKAQKKLAKVKESNNKSQLKELKHFIRAYSYKYMGEEAALEKEKEQISNVDYLMQLEK